MVSRRRSAVRVEEMCRFTDEAERTMGRMPTFIHVSTSHPLEGSSRYRVPSIQLADTVQGLVGKRSYVVLVVPLLRRSSCYLVARENVLQNMKARALAARRRAEQ